MCQPDAPHPFQDGPMCIGKQQIFQFGMHEKEPRNSTNWSMKLVGSKNSAPGAVS